MTKYYKSKINPLRIGFAAVFISFGVGIISHNTNESMFLFGTIIIAIGLGILNL